MNKLTGTTWGTDTVIPRRPYTGRVRPVLEYGMTAWDTTAKSNFDRVSKVQSQAARIITGAMKSTRKVETMTWLQSHDDCRDYQLLTQAVNFKRLQGHLMRQRLSQPAKGRLKRGGGGGGWRGVSSRAQYLNDDRRTSLIMSPPPPPSPIVSYRLCLE